MRKLAISLVAACAAMSLALPALAQSKGAGKYAAGVFERPGQSTQFSMPGKAKGKIQIKPSKKDGDGGWTIQLNVKGIDCAVNDSGPGTCGPKGAAEPGQQLELNIFVLGAVAAQAAIEFEIEKGKTKFFTTGKNKQGAGGAGALVTILFDTVMAIDGLRLHETGSDPTNPTTGCGVIPLPASNTCLDGQVWGVAGILVGEDNSLTCTTTAECDNSGANPTLICTAGACVAEPCTADGDCDQDGGGSGGTGECNCTAGTCCDDATLPGCSSIC